MKDLAFEKLDGNWILRVDAQGNPVLTDHTLEALIQGAKTGQQGSFLDIGRYTSITIAGSAQELSEVMGSIEPDAPLSHDLYESYEELRENNIFTDVGPINTGMVVNGASWGWIPTRIEPLAFALVPLVDNPRDVVAFSAWQSESMTGAVENWSVRLYGDVAVLCHEADDSEPEATYMEPHYFLPDSDEMLALVTRDWTDDSYDPDTPCPVCAEEGENWMGGWILTFRTDGSFSQEEIGRAMATVWKPCTDHAKTTVTIRDDNGDSWRWAGDRWAPAPANGEDH